MTEILRLPEFATKGLNTDLLPWDLDGNYITNVQNMRILNGKLSPTGGNRVWANLPDDILPGFLMHVGSTIGRFWIIAGKTKIYVYDGNTDQVFDNISSAVGYAGIINQDLWNGCLMGEIAVLNHREHFPEPIGHFVALY